MVVWLPTGTDDGLNWAMNLSKTSMSSLSILLEV